MLAIMKCYAFKLLTCHQQLWLVNLQYSHSAYVECPWLLLELYCKFTNYSCWWQVRYWKVWLFNSVWLIDSWKLCRLRRIYPHNKCQHRWTTMINIKLYLTDWSHNFKNRRLDFLCNLILVSLISYQRSDRQVINLSSPFSFKDESINKYDISWYEGWLIYE